MTEARTTASGPANGTADGVIALINARLIDPASGTDQLGGVVIENGLISDFGPQYRLNAPAGAEVIDCQGDIVLAPGIVDMQVFTGEPGNEHRETLKTASRAAAAGGVTTMVGDARHRSPSSIRSPSSTSSSAARATMPRINVAHDGGDDGRAATARK
jgi:dihydroorotase-like cyclic amidohydrolase